MSKPARTGRVRITLDYLDTGATSTHEYDGSSYELSRSGQHLYRESDPNQPFSYLPGDGVRATHHFWTTPHTSKDSPEPPAHLLITDPVADQIQTIPMDETGGRTPEQLAQIRKLVEGAEPLHGLNLAPVLTSHSCQIHLENPSDDPREPDWVIGRIQSLAIKASTETDAFWTVSAIQYNPDTKLNVMLEFYLIGIDFQVPTGGRPAWEFQQKITVRLKKESEIPYGFYWDEKRGRVDRRHLPQL